MQFVYADWASTGMPNCAENLQALDKAQKYFGNPSSTHCVGKEARKALENSRQHIAQMLGCPADRIFFTAGGTESDQIILLSQLAKQSFSKTNIAVSGIEHAAVTNMIVPLSNLGCEVRTIPVTDAGFVTPEAVLDTIDDNTSIVSVMTVNNETGAIQPISEIAAVLRRENKRHILFHSDAVQAIGKTHLNIAELDADALSLSAHKIGGLRGIGILYLKKPIEVFCKGGNQEGGIRSGTENLAGIFSLEAALKKYGDNFEANRQQAKMCMSFLLAAVAEMEKFTVIPQQRLLSEYAERYSPFLVQLAHKSYTGEVMVRILSDQGIAASTGSACSAKRSDRPVLQAMHVDKHLQQHGFRISFGSDTTLEQVQYIVDVFKKL